jgi:hypothetical protein
MNLKFVRRPGNKIQPELAKRNDSTNELFSEHNSNNLIDEDSQVIKLKGFNDNKYFCKFRDISGFI